MNLTKRKSSRPLRARVRTELNGKNESFRDLKAFGLWANRIDLKDSVQFTKQLRARLERGDEHFKALPGVKVIRPY